MVSGRPADRHGGDRVGARRRNLRPVAACVVHPGLQRQHHAVHRHRPAAAVRRAARQDDDRVFAAERGRVAVQGAQRLCAARRDADETRIAADSRPAVGIPVLRRPGGGPRGDAVSARARQPGGVRAGAAHARFLSRLEGATRHDDPSEPADGARAAPRGRPRDAEGRRLQRRRPREAAHRRRQHVDRNRSVQLPPARPRRARQGRHPRRRRDADGVQHGVDLRRHHDEHRGHEDVAREPRGDDRLDRARRARQRVRRPHRARRLRQDDSGGRDGAGAG